MTALGKRYIAVLRSNSPPDIDIADTSIYKNAEFAASAHQNYTEASGVVVDHVLIVDLDALPRTDFTDEQLAMHAERMALYWAAEFDRLAPCLGGHPARESETVRMRAVIEAMRPIVEAALTWMDTRGDPPRATPAGDLRRAVVANRERLALAMSAWENSQTVSEKPPTPCSGCSDDCNCKCGNNYCGCPCHKLREQAAEVRR